jgi:hypothetical protein
MAAVAAAASLGLDSQVTALLHGSPLERSIARITVRSALKLVDRRARVHAYYVAALNNGQPIKD